MHHDAIEKHVNKRLEYSSATIFLIPTGHKIGQKSVQIIVLLRGDVIKRTTGPEACPTAEIVGIFFLGKQKKCLYKIP